MTDEIMNAVAEEAATEVVTETAKNTWSLPEIAVAGLAIYGAFKAGQAVAKGVKMGINWIKAKKEINKYEVDGPDLTEADLKEAEVVEIAEKKTGKK